ncbi:MAG: DUF4910 domain-containing protein [Thermoanaerobaculia bacterium]|nr:DUF4910 domain-containing protein [Thermoanaerobaculia bacterium]
MSLENSRHVEALRRDLSREETGRRLMAWIEKLYPIPRSITGPGLRRTLEWIQERLPDLERREAPTGTKVLDWEVPREWRVREAWIRDPSGRKLADFDEHNLHLVGYSVPVDREVERAELEEHLHSLPEHPDWIPYRTSYYSETWGFCLTHRQREALPEGIYRVRIDSELVSGALSWGELVLPGREEGEILLSCHVCHPSLANDNLSSLAVAVALAGQLGELQDRRWTYRFLFVPGTIGAITWLASNRETVARIRAGLVLANLGDCGGFTYKRTHSGTAWIDRVMERLSAETGTSFEHRPFSPFGYDERQYNSPGFRLPVGRLTRTPHGEYPEYHTSADDLSLVEPEALAGSLDLLLAAAEILEGDDVYRNLAPYGEPQLGRRGLYRSLGGGTEGRERELALLWVLNQSDGGPGLLEIAARAGLPFRRIREAAAALVDAELLVPGAP